MRATKTPSWLETALEYWPYIRPEFYENSPLKKRFWTSKSIQTAGYNGARTVYIYLEVRIIGKYVKIYLCSFWLQAFANFTSVTVIKLLQVISPDVNSKLYYDVHIFRDPWSTWKGVGDNFRQQHNFRIR